MKLLHRCMHVVKDMYVTVTLDVREDPLADCGMQDLFYMSRKMTAALLRAAREEQFPLEDAVFLKPGKQSRLAQTPVLQHLEQNLFRVKAQQYAGDCQKELQIYSLATPREELQFAAWKISDRVIVMASVPLCVAMWNVMKNMHSQSFPCMTFRILWI